MRLQVCDRVLAHVDLARPQSYRAPQVMHAERLSDSGNHATWDARISPHRARQKSATFPHAEFAKRLG